MMSEAVKKYRKKNVEKVREWKRKYNFRHKEKIKEANKKWSSLNVDKKKEYSTKWHKEHREEELAKMKDRHNRIRDSILNHYSNGCLKCACCGESNKKFLSLDHINNDGGEHRKLLCGVNKGAGTMEVYRWIVKNNFPTGFQVLCMNCNWGKRMNGGICPHKEQ